MPRQSSTTYEPGDEPNRCCAKSKTSGDRCKRSVVPGRKVCRYHGGLGGAPVKHGRYSQSVGRFREAYQEARSDPSLLDLRETLALLDVAVQRAAQRAAEGDIPDFRQQALDLFDRIRVAANPEEAARLLNRLGELLRAGVKDDEALDHMAKAAERLSRRQEKAWSIKLDAAVALNARDLTAVLARFADIVLEEVPKDAAARVIRRIDSEVLGTGPAAVGLEVGDAT
jgi:tetratricopeptide (TPR) repeat protein